MTEPISLNSSSARFELPFLYPAQAQKELFVNEAFSRIDALLHPVVEGSIASPPPSPADGESWIVASGAVAEWSGRDGSIAHSAAGTWLFFQPRDGMIAFDRSLDQFVHYRSGWIVAEKPQAPDGGTTVDLEARAAIAELLEQLSSIGLFSRV